MITIKIATENDLSACIKIRQIAKASPEGHRLGGNMQKEANWTKKKWRKFFFGQGKITVLALNGTEPVGIAIPRKRLIQDDWYLSSVFIVEDFRGKIFLRMWQCGIQEIKKQNGKILRFTTSKTNENVLKPAKYFGFKKVKIFKQFFLTGIRHMKYIPWCVLMEKKIL